jgi:Fis family transcriptional regulator
MDKCALANSVKASLDQYFKDLEKPLLEYVMQFAGGNQSKAAEILDINRNTLRKKLQQYNIQ